MFEVDWYLSSTKAYILLIYIPSGKQDGFLDNRFSVSLPPRYLLFLCSYITVKM